MLPLKRTSSSLMLRAAAATPRLGWPLSLMGGVEGRTFRRRTMSRSSLPAKLLLLFTLMSCACWTSGTPMEEAALITMKLAMVPQGSSTMKKLDDTWVMGVDMDMCRTWMPKCGMDCPVQITCDSTNEHIVSLALYGSAFAGFLSPAIGDLKELQSLEISSTLLSGPIPPRIGELKKLTSLTLTDNKFTGSLSPWLSQLTALTEARIDGNQFSGPIPADINNLIRLRSLLMSTNALRGPIPPQLGACRELRVLDLSENLLTGNIPSALGNLDNLNELRLGSNYLDGPIPKELANVDALQQLWLDAQKGSSKLSGSIPKEFGSLPGLIVLNLAGNDLTGTIPRSLSKILSQKNGATPILDLSDNSLVGRIPSTFRDMDKINPFATLNLDGNYLTGLPLNFKVKLPPSFTDSNNCLRSQAKALKCLAMEASSMMTASSTGDVDTVAPGPLEGVPLDQLLDEALSPAAIERLVLEEGFLQRTARNGPNLAMVFGVAAAALLAVFAVIALLSQYSTRHTSAPDTSKSQSGMCQFPLLVEVRVGGSERSVMAGEGVQNPGSPAASM